MQTAQTNLKGIQILHFKDAELTKLDSEGTIETQTEYGALNVVFFPEIDRFVLFFNNWEYVLLKRLQITSSSRNEVGTRIYTLPFHNGTYTLKLNNVEYPDSIHNLEAIISWNSRLSLEGDDSDIRELPPSPEEGAPEISAKFSEHVGENARGTHRKLSSQLKEQLEMITGKAARYFAMEHKDNINMLEKRNIESIKSTPETTENIVYVPRAEVKPFYTLPTFY